MVSNQVKDEICSGLRHELRREILRTMDRADDPLSPKELADTLEVPLSRLSYHVEILADCHLVKRSSTSQVRGMTMHSFLPDQKVKDYPFIRAMLGLEPPAGFPDEARDLRAFGDRVKELREASGLSQQGLAEQTDLTVEQLQDLELGLFSPLMGTVVMLAAIFEVEVGEIVSGPGR